MTRDDRSESIVGSESGDQFRADLTGRSDDQIVLHGKTLPCLKGSYMVWIVVAEPCVGEMG